MGSAGDFKSPTFASAVDTCARHGKSAGFMATNVEDGKAALSAGFRCIAFSNDVRIYRRALADGINRLRGET